ncbi:hypothetical protein BHM03_00046672 [Ensete ventricosum]|nr:hypothetical protein BHM03_00046672 [Ensete ventricosum]
MTQSTGSFFADRSTTLGTLMGVTFPEVAASPARLPSRRDHGLGGGGGAAGDAGRRTKPRAAEQRRRRRHRGRSGWWRLCRDDMAGPTSLGEFLQVERRMAGGDVADGHYVFGGAAHGGRPPEHVAVGGGPLKQSATPSRNCGPGRIPRLGREPSSHSTPPSPRLFLLDRLVTVAPTLRPVDASSPFFSGCSSPWPKDGRGQRRRRRNSRHCVARERRSHRLRSISLLLVLVSSWNAPSPQPPRPQHRAMRGAGKKAASEELERRSQYLSSLVQRTKIMGDNAAAAADHDKKEVVEATAAKPERREQLRQCSQQRMQEKEVVEERREKKKGVGDGDRCVGDARDPPQGQQQQKEEEMNVKVRAADMSLALQKHAFRCARETLTSMPKLESKRLALALKKARPRPSMPSFPYRSSGSIIIIYFSFLK